MSHQTARISSRLDLLYLVAREFSTGLGNIEQVLYNVLSATVASVAASDASLFLFDDNGNLENSILISGFEQLQPSPETLKIMSEQGVAGYVKHHKKGIIIKDAQSDKQWYRNAIDTNLSQAGSALCVPIQLPDQLIGILMITAPQTNHFDDSDLSMLSIIADHTAIAVSKARLFNTEQHRRRLADTLASITNTINSTLNIKEVLSLILEQLSLVVEYDSSSILLYEDDGQTLAVHAARGFDDMADALNVKLPFDENIPNYQAILLKKPVLISDVDQEPYWIKSSSSQSVRSWIGVPLIAREEVVGMLTVDSHEPHKYTEENVKVVAAFANQAATAVYNAQVVARLKNAEASYSALFEDNTDMIIITNYEGLILAVNRTTCLVLRRHKDALINLNIAFIDSRLPGYLTKHTKRLQVWREAAFELNVKDAYRQPVSLEFKMRQVQFRGKDCVQWVARDISERKEIEKMREDMVHMIVHDLRGPLSNVSNALDLTMMLLEKEPDTDKIKYFLDMAKRSSQSVHDLVDTILDVSRLEQDEIPLQQFATDIHSLLQSVEEQVSPRAATKQTQLVIQPPEEPVEALLDNNMIRRVLVNLVDNAIKYTPNEGHVSLIASIENNHLIFAISDDGPGISKSEQVHIFDKFARVDHSSTTPGIGLGLAFCKLATEAHNGTISVESEGIPDKGSTFYVTIPLILA